MEKLPVVEWIFLHPRRHMQHMLNISLSYFPAFREMILLDIVLTKQQLLFHNYQLFAM